MIDRQRSQFRIIYDLLKAIRDRGIDGELKTRLMYNVNINSKQVNDYLNICKRYNFLTIKVDESSQRELYYINDNGKKFIDITDVIVSQWGELI
jgi:predicted transcriptional regulator